MRIATFNVENLFTRYVFARGVNKAAAIRDGFTSEDLRFRLADGASKRITAEVLLTLHADVVALQEVEGLDTLKKFRDQFLGGRHRWPHALVIDGNDSRRIDVGVLSKLPITHARSWQHLWNRKSDSPVFDRDCLEVDVHDPEIGTVTLYINHFKSMRARRNQRGSGRALTQPRRRQQALMVKQLVESRFGQDPSEAAFVVLGDFNDYRVDDEQGPSAIRELLEWDAIENVLDRLPESERWTHFYPGSRHHHTKEAYRQLDYVLVSRRIGRLNQELPWVERAGMPLRAKNSATPRLEGIGFNRPKASDHCPLVFEIKTL